jgi:hypothetical protein
MNLGLVCHAFGNHICMLKKGMHSRTGESPFPGTLVRITDLRGDLRLANN